LRKAWLSLLGADNVEAHRLTTTIGAKVFIVDLRALAKRRFPAYCQTPRAAPLPGTVIQDRTMRRYSAGSAILIGGMVAGAFDLAFAIGFSAVRGNTPSTILQSVASGLLGTAAFDGGTATRS
jgi:hypothetical protein